MIKRLLFITFCLTLSACNLFRQASQSSLDSSAETLISQGKRLIRTGNYADAMDKFEMAWDRDYHRSSSAALYLTGLSAYYAGYDEVATERFGTFLSLFPKSRYLEEVRYHQSLLLLRSKSSRDRTKGIAQLQDLADKAQEARIREQAQLQWQAQLFEKLPLSELRKQYEAADGKRETEILEALSYRLQADQQREEARTLYDGYVKNGGIASPYLKKLFSDEQAQEPVLRVRTEPQMFRIAMFLPLFLNQPVIQYNQEIPGESVRGLEFYEGFQLAMDELSEQQRKQIYLKVFDTNRDTFATKNYLKELDLIQPDIVVGGIYNNQSRILSSWSEERQIPQIIPLSPTEELVQDKKFTFLAHPSVKTHGARMADYAWNQLGLKHVSVFSDRSEGTQPLADGFTAKFLEFGGTIDSLILDTDYEIAVKQIPRLVDQIPDYEDSTGVYIPLMNNEEGAGLVINLLRQRTKKVTVMGSPHFRSRYNTLSRDIKESFQLLFTTSQMIDPQDPAYRNLYNRYAEKYDYPPSDNVIQGYDLARYLLDLVRQYNPGPGTMHTYLRGASKYQGIHLKYWFDFTQSNQDVNIGQYLESGIKRVND